MGQRQVKKFSKNFVVIWNTFIFLTNLKSCIISILQVFTDSSTATVGALVLFCQLAFVGIVAVFIIKKARQLLENIEASNEDKNPSYLQPDFEIIVMPKMEKNEVQNS